MPDQIDANRQTLRTAQPDRVHLTQLSMESNQLFCSRRSQQLKQGRSARSRQCRGRHQTAQMRINSLNHS